MAYYTGSAVDMAAVRQALIDACTTEGWSWDGGNEVLSKGTLFVRLQVVSGFLTLLGRTGATSGSAPSVVRVGNFPDTPLTWPVVYNVFVFANEVFLVINYSVSYHQFAAFGLSRVDGLPGTGMWVAATLEQTTPVTPAGISMGPDYGNSTDNCVSPGLFWASMSDAARNRNYWIHSDLDAQGWWPGQTQGGVLIGIRAAGPLIGLLPNNWNSESVLLPIRGYKIRPSSKVSLTVDVENARYCRVDYYEPGEVIELGADRWKVFPWYLKNPSGRQGGHRINHTGTFGWAIRYEGP
ncbi:hypothetical protein [Zestomonas carbonaria]|uniref:Uncharacterized protein n=1 Tax=Zestomonas carbonaria TaxID=2762745 RepID=A0A7U7EMM2_9GAMM|nr:hypothetical protein [Pseudomonas carbonaria]CAD5107242.1 hypothetical protein PSEWESI4_01513 [Pseudomonas carbonaria]